MFTSALIGGIAGAVAVLAYSLLKKPMRCEACNAEQPRFRTPASGRQALSGGITCVGCGKELDRHGKVVAPR